MFSPRLSGFPRSKGLLLTLAASSCLAFTGAQAQLLINVDLNGGQYNGQGAASGGGATQTGAAVIGAAGDVWNGFDNTNPTSGNALVAANGTPTGATLSYSVDGGYAPLGPGGNNGQDAFTYQGTPYSPLMNDWFSVNGGNTNTVTISGLSANTPYKLYLYSEANVGPNQRPINFNVTGDPSTLTLNPYYGLGTFVTPAQAAALDPSDGNYNASNYDILNPVSDATGNIVISFARGTNNNSEGDFDGFQLQSTVPEPSATWALCLGSAVLGLGVWKRSRRVA